MDKKQLVDWLMLDIGEHIESKENAVDMVLSDLDGMSESTLIVLKKRISFLIGECLNFEKGVGRLKHKIDELEDEVSELEDEVSELKVEKKRLLGSHETAPQLVAKIVEENKSSPWHSIPPWKMDEIVRVIGDDEYERVRKNEQSKRR